MTKFDYETIKSIYQLRSDGWTIAKIAEKYRVTPQRMGQIIKHDKHYRNSTEDCTLGLSSRVLNCLRRVYIPIEATAIADHIDVLLRTDGIGKSALMEIGKMLSDRNIIADVDEWIERGRRKNRLSNNSVKKMGHYPTPYKIFSNMEKEHSI
ncbi:hypothetical protein LLG96_11245 [bacterium]|nr:hypothetical protein [bacterium]